MIVLVHGPDAATAHAAVAKVLAGHDPDGEATTRLDGRTVSLGEAAAMAGTPGFFGHARVIVIDDLMARAAKGAVDADPRTSDSSSALKLDLAPLFNAVAPENMLILVDPTLASIPAAIKKAAPHDVQIIAGEPLRGKPLLDWMRQSAQEAGSDLPATLAKELAEMLFPRTWAARPSNPRYDRPPDLSLIRNEVQKLALAAHPGAIDRHHLRELTAEGSVDRLFPFLEAAVGGAVGQAAAELRVLRDAGEDGHRIAAQLFQQIELAAAQDAAGRGLDPVEVGRRLGLPNPNRMIGIARGQRRIAPRRAVEAARVIDRAVKTGELRDPLDVLYGLIPVLAGGADPNRQRSG